ncbi:preQ(0) biosynthesis protein QueD [Desulfocicer vacuolatum DSM 3385]|uniref:6-carboxy-5,6,7,8-tetrahydropterin synthase n=1 Tax=Desulfocicer vacuolatum DSM 3385 TaxID=1121400 RepID=A0A1W1ZTI4_9BACT|nr:6-carboxytetrahydropterin synthase QueD [Desulfocicer vacuolatum]SMC51572.1 preQ(0) biosynthesis protein QueD [Desulfocicer vacuolatum DSM 3385]
MFELKVKTDFAAAHQLTMVGEKCENLHGHNWNVEVYVAGEHLNAAGVLVDFGDIKKHVRAIMKELDHKFLNELDAFKGIQPSSEQIAIYIANRLQGYLKDDKLDETVRVSRVSAWESADACATYIPPQD